METTTTTTIEGNRKRCAANAECPYCDKTSFSPAELRALAKSSFADYHFHSYSHVTSAGTWAVWRGGDVDEDMYMRLYRSPSGQYFVGNVRYHGWGGRFWRDGRFVEPWRNMNKWLDEPLQAAPPTSLGSLVDQKPEWFPDFPAILGRPLPAGMPACMVHWLVVYPAIEARPTELMQWVAAAWVIDCDLVSFPSSTEKDELDYITAEWPDLVSKIRQLQQRD